MNIQRGGQQPRARGVFNFNSKYPGVPLRGRSKDKDKVIETYA
jgi:hypothetical protein